MTATAAPPAHAQVEESSERAQAVAPPVRWPAFSDALDEPSPPPLTAPGWRPNSILTATPAVVAPLPQAVATGIFMLAGNWIAVRLWKQRKI